MIFTQEDFKKIEEWLYQRTIKDSAFPLVKSISGNETVPVIQNNENKRVILNDLVKRMTELGYLDLVNVMRYSDKKSKISLADAVDIVPINSRKLGLIITFCNEEGNWCIYQFTGVNTKQWNSLEYWEDIIDELVEGLVFFPDEEDLTYVLKEHKKYLKFKNKDYNPEDFSGLGRVILRKEYTGTEACSVDDTDHLTNVLKQEQINKPNTIYIIQYDFDLMGETISVPENSILWFQGGTLNNGNLHLKETTILGTLKLEDIGTATLFGTYAKGTIMEFTETNYQSKTGDYFAEPSTKESSATHEEDPKDDREFFIDKNTSAYTTVQREELKWWNGTEWIYLLDITDYKELKTIIESLIEKHNTEVSECYKYFKKRCAALESRMTSAENRLTAAESNIATNTQNIQTNTEDIATLKEDHKNFTTILDPAAEDTNQAAENIKALGTGYDSLIAVSKTLKDFLTTTDDADSVINKFKEVEAFLKNITEEQTLTGLLTENLNSANNYTDTKVAKRVLLGENEVPEDLNFTLHTNVSSGDKTTGFKLQNGSFISKAKSYIVNSGEILLNNVFSSSSQSVGISITNSGIKFTNLGKEFTLPDTSGVLALHSEIPTDYVTLGTDQAISGTKTFSSTVIGNLGFKVDSTSYEDNKVRHSDIQNSFPDRDGKLALDDDLSSKVSLTGDESIRGTKTFINTVKAPNFEITNVGGEFIVDGTKYKKRQIVDEYTGQTYDLPNHGGILATLDDIQGQSFNFILNAGNKQGPKTINSGDTLDLSDLYDGSSGYPTLISVLDVKWNTTTIVVTRRSGIVFSTKAEQIKTDTQNCDRISLSKIGFKVTVSSATAVINTLINSNDGQATESTMKAVYSRRQGIAFRIQTSMQDSTASIDIQGIRTRDKNNDSVAYENPYDCGIGSYTVFVFGYISKV